MKSEKREKEDLQGNMRLTAFFKLYKMCILLHRCDLKIFAKNRFEKSAIFVKFSKKFANVAKSAKFCKIAKIDAMDDRKMERWGSGSCLMALRLRGLAAPMRASLACNNGGFSVNEETTLRMRRSSKSFRPSQILRVVTWAAMNRVVSFNLVEKKIDQQVQLYQTLNLTTSSNHSQSVDYLL